MTALVTIALWTCTTAGALGLIALALWISERMLQRILISLRGWWYLLLYIRCRRRFQEWLRVAPVANEEEVSLLARALRSANRAVPARERAIRCALQELVRLKDLKDAEGKTAEYEAAQPVAWQIARKALAGQP